QSPAPASATKPPGGRRASDPKQEPPPGITRAHVTVPTQRPQALVERISDEVRRGHVPRSAQPRAIPKRSYGILWVALLLIALAGAGAWFAYHGLRSDARRAAGHETLPAGTERVLPADLGSANPGVPDRPEPTQPSSAGDVSG